MPASILLSITYKLCRQLHDSSKSQRSKRLDNKAASIEKKLHKINQQVTALAKDQAYISGQLQVIVGTLLILWYLSDVC